VSAARRKGKWIGGIPVLGYEIAPGGGRLVVHPDEADRIREIFQLCARARNLPEALTELRARGCTAKQWTSRRGQTHGGGPLRLSTLRLLLTNVLYRGDIAHKGVMYRGEQEALVSRELWQEVTDKHRLSRSQPSRHKKVETPLGGLVRCEQCGFVLTTSYTQRQGQRHVYYLCRAGKKQPPACPQQPLSVRDLEDALRERLERGGSAAGTSFAQAVRTATYHSGTRRVKVELRDENRFDFVLPVPVRRAVKRLQTGARQRPLRITRLMALAIHLNGLVVTGKADTFRELAAAGHVSRARLSQIVQLTHLAPDIQEELLFLPPTRRGPDPLLERHLRALARLVDWEAQKQRFRAVRERLSL
jgi:site-specific DNA recombinase